MLGYISRQLSLDSGGEGDYRSIAQLLNGMYADGSVGDLNVGFAKAMEP